MIQDALPRTRPGRNSTIKDVARLAGVAFSTASVVLNNKPKPIGSETRARIRAAALELGYSPNPAARSLVTKRTHIIALLITEMASAFSARIAMEIQDQARHHGYEMLISNISGPAQALDSAQADSLGMRQSLWQVDGAITYLGLVGGSRLMESLSLRQVPVVSLGAIAIDGADSVGVDLFPGAREAVRRLVGSGCRRIAYLAPANADFSGDARHDAYQGAVREAGQESQIITIPSSHVDMRAGARKAIIDHLSRNDVMDGLFCFNDECAIGAYRALRDRGLRVPDDVSIIGCNGIEDTKYLDCPLSTLVLPVEEMCQTAWDLLKLRMEAPEREARRIVLSTHLEERDSIRRIQE